MPRAKKGQIRYRDRVPTARPSRRIAAVCAAVAGLALLAACAVRAGDAATTTDPPAEAAPSAQLEPARSQYLAVAERVIDNYAASADVANADAGWSWATFYMSVAALYAETGDPHLGALIRTWGERNSWMPDGPESRTSNPDDRAAIQVWTAASDRDPAVDLTGSSEAMASDLALPAERYWWIDSLFMGLPTWAEWAQHTGDDRYAARIAYFYTFLKTDGGPSWLPQCGHHGLFDESEDLWWRDCRFVERRDALGHKVFWARGNGWVMAALVRTMAALPADSPQRPELSQMLTRIAAKVASLQGGDGMWRSNLLSPTIYPAPETSGTALFTYAIASGISMGDLDAATYRPVVDRAWAGLSSVLSGETGTVTGCQDVGESPAAPSETASPPFCVGAVGLAAVAMAGIDRRS